jgi:hypothetical protein
MQTHNNINILVRLTRNGTLCEMTAIQIVR